MMGYESRSLCATTNWLVFCFLVLVLTLYAIKTIEFFTNYNGYELIRVFIVLIILIIMVFGLWRTYMKLT